jgi:hypothetical protein
VQSSKWKVASKDRVLLALIIIVTLVIALPTLTYPLGRDQGEFATIGRGILDGRVPYRDLWNPKPPAVFYVYSLAMTLLGRTSVALRAIDFFIVPVICWALYWLGKRISNNRVGLWAALLFPVFYFTETFWTLTQNDGIVLLPMTLAMVCVFKTVDSFPTKHSTFSAVLWGFLAGGLGAYVVWFKYPFAAFVVLEVVAYLLLIRQGLKPPGYQKDKPTKGAENQRAVQVDNFVSTRIFLSSVFAFLLGLIVVGGGGILYMMSIGAWDDLVESARVTSQYTALTFNLADFGPLLATALGYRWSQWGLLGLLAAVWLVGWLWNKARGSGWWVTVLWLATGIVIMVAQAKAYDYHWLPMLPPLVLMGAGGIDWLFCLFNGRRNFTPPPWPTGSDPLPASDEGEEIQQSQTVNSASYPQSSVLSTQSFSLITAFFLLALMAASIWPKVWPYLTGQQDQVTYFQGFVVGAADEFQADESLQVANLLRERVAPGDTLFIWGFRPEVYYLSQLNPATRFIFQFPLVGSWYPPEWREEAVDTLWAAMPPYALVLQVDYMPWVTGSNEDSNTLLQGYTEMNNWLIANYERDTQIGNFFLWRRKP